MAIQLRRLTAREHALSASVLSYAVTMLSADITMPYGNQLRMAGHTTMASLETVLPIVLFVSALLVLLPRTGNESKIDWFRIIGKLPLLIRYFIVVLSFVGIQAMIEKFFG